MMLHCTNKSLKARRNVSLYEHVTSDIASPFTLCFAWIVKFLPTSWTKGIRKQFPSATDRILHIVIKNFGFCMRICLHQGDPVT